MELMKTSEDFRQFYEDKLVPEFRRLEKKRRQTVTMLVAGTIVLAFVILLFLIWMQALNGIIFFGYFGFMISAFVLYPYLLKRYARSFKPAVIGRIVRFVSKELKYKPDGFVSTEEFAESGLFQTQSGQGYKGDDLVWGELGNVRIRFSEVEARTPNFWGEIRAPRVSFKGLFFIGEFNKSLKGRTFVLPDISEKIFGCLGRKAQEQNVLRGQLVKLEDPEFEKEFVVYGTDQIEPRYVLSTSLMRRILDFQKKCERKIMLSFAASKVYVAIPFERDLFEPRLFRTLLDFEPIAEYFEDLQLAIGIVEDLNLNTRIWSKQ
jgi:hypothetical protein